MAKLDQKLTQQIQDWLNTPEADRDIVAGAEMLLRLSRNMALYNSAVRHPQKFAPKVAYELRKYLNMRLNNMAVSDVVELEQKVMPRVAETLSVPVMETVISVDDEHPEGLVAKGKRPDHDSLPEEIREIFAINTERRKRIDLLFNELKAMSGAQPCDRYEKLHILDETEAAYRRDWERYDNYRPGEPEPMPDEEIKKRLSAARKKLSKYRGVYAKEQDEAKNAVALEKLTAAVNDIRELGGDISDDTRLALLDMGVKL